MSRSKVSTKFQTDNSFSSQMTGGILSKSGVIEYCLNLLKALLEYWKKYATNMFIFKIYGFVKSF